MRGIIIAAAAALLVAGVTIAQDEPSPGMSPDETQQMLKDHSHEPDLSSDSGGETSSGMHTSHSESSSSSSSVSFSAGGSSNADDNAAAQAAVARMLFGHHGGATAHASGGGTSCSAPAVGKCAACSIACPAGQAAQCRAGDMGIMTMACPTASKCTCKG